MFNRQNANKGTQPVIVASEYAPGGACITSAAHPEPERVTPTWVPRDELLKRFRVTSEQFDAVVSRADFPKCGRTVDMFGRAKLSWRDDALERWINERRAEHVTLAPFLR